MPPVIFTTGGKELLKKQSRDLSDNLVARVLPDLQTFVCLMRYAQPGSVVVAWHPDNVDLSVGAVSRRDRTAGAENIDATRHYIPGSLDSCIAVAPCRRQAR